MKKPLALCAAVLILCVGSVAAQSFPGDFYIAGMWYSTADTVARIDGTTFKISTFVKSFSTVTSRNYHQEIMMAEDNSDFYLLASSLRSLYRVDANGNVFQTVVNGTFSSPYDMLLDQNGNIVVADSGNGLLQVNPALKTVTTILTQATLGTYARGITVEIESGNLLIAGGDSFIHRYDWITGQTTIVSARSPGSFRFNLEQDHATGLLYTGTCCSTNTGGSAMFAFDLAGQTSTVLVGATTPALRAWYAHRFDRRVQKPGANMMYASVNGFAITNNPSCLVKMTTQGVITTLVSYGPPANGVLTAYGMEIGGSRNLSPVRTAAPNNRDVFVSFPAHGGKAYVIAASLTGMRPAVPLGDGRQINLIPDSLTVVTVNNLLPGLWSPGPGKLDAAGLAQAKLNLNLLGSALRGIPVWLAAIVLDPAAPVGIAAVSETLVLRLE